jgi:hypothetical protein
MTGFVSNKIVFLEFLEDGSDKPIWDLYFSLAYDIVYPYQLVEDDWERPPDWPSGYAYHLVCEGQETTIRCDDEDAMAKYDAFLTPFLRTTESSEADTS